MGNKHSLYEKLEWWRISCLQPGTSEKSSLTITVSNSSPLALWTVPTMKSGSGENGIETNSSQNTKSPPRLWLDKCSIIWQKPTQLWFQLALLITPREKFRWGRGFFFKQIVHLKLDSVRYKWFTAVHLLNLCKHYALVWLTEWEQRAV